MSAKSGSLSILAYNWDCKSCPLYRVACRVSGVSIEVNGRTVGTFRIVHYIMGVRFSGVSVKRGSTVWWESNEGISMQVWEMLRKRKGLFVTSYPLLF